jgi:hypothetical protein
MVGRIFAIEVIMNGVDKPGSNDNVVPLREPVVGPSLALVPELSQAAISLEAASQRRWQSQKMAVQKRWLMLHANELDNMNGDAEPLIDLITVCLVAA